MDGRESTGEEKKVWNVENTALRVSRHFGWVLAFTHTSYKP